MRHGLIALAAAAAMAAGGGGGGGGGGGEGEAAGGQPANGEAELVIDMNDALQFEPAEVTVSVGDTVTWRNVGTLGHTITADPGRASDPSNVELPDGAEEFDSGNVMEGEEFTHTFTEPGTYRYFCVPHEGAHMVAEVTVE
jgi:plastocyanin